MGRYPTTPQELSSWASHYKKCPPDYVLLKRIASELVELRVLLFNINRDPKKSPVLEPHQIAPDLFDKPTPKSEQDVVDNFGAQLFEGFAGFSDG